MTLEGPHNALDAVHVVHVQAVTTDSPWFQQVKLAMSTNIMVSLHGSALGSIEIWMPSGSILISVFTPLTCQCRFAYCASASEERSFLYVAATTAEANCQQGGPWLDNGKKGAWVPPELHSPRVVKEVVALQDRVGYSRHFNYTSVLQGLRATLAAPGGEELSSKFVKWALQEGHHFAQLVCGKMALQIIDDAVPPIPITDRSDTDDGHRKTQRANMLETHRHVPSNDIPSNRRAEHEEHEEQEEQEEREQRFYVKCMDSFADEMVRLRFKVLDAALVSAEADRADLGRSDLNSAGVFFLQARPTRAHPWATAYRDSIGFDKVIVIWFPRACFELLKAETNSAVFAEIVRYSFYMVSLVLVMEQQNVTLVMPSHKEIMEGDPIDISLIDFYLMETIALDTDISDHDVELADANEAIKASGALVDGFLRNLANKSRDCHQCKGCNVRELRLIDSILGEGLLDGAEANRVDKVDEVLISEFRSSVSSLAKERLIATAYLPWRSTELDTSARRAVHLQNVIADMSKALKAVQWRVENVASIDCGKPQERSHSQRSHVEELFRDGAEGADHFCRPVQASKLREPLGVYRFRNVCITDLADKTDFGHSDSWQQTGRRLELVTFGLGTNGTKLVLPPDGRFVATHYDFAEAETERIRRNVSYLQGTSLFWYDGHIASLRCPDCSNIDHHVQDDAILDWITAYFGVSNVTQIVFNNHASDGHLKPRKWFAQVAALVASAIKAPFHYMQKAETLCFDDVVLNFWVRNSNCYDCWMYRDNILFPGFSLRPVLRWVRDAIWRAHGSPPMNLSKIIAYGRQSEVSRKPRTWRNFNKVLRLTNATLIDFRKMSLREEVHTMMQAKVMLTVVGAHLPAALFMRPGSTWVELSCKRVVEQQWGQAWHFLFSALDVEYLQLDALDCPQTAPLGLDVNPWIPAQKHPVMMRPKVSSLSSHVVPICHAGKLCIFRENVATLAAPVAPVTPVAPSENLELDISCSGAAVLARLSPTFDLLTLMRRCVEWGSECFSIDTTDGGKMYRRKGAAWNKVACTWFDKASETAYLTALRWQTNRTIADKPIVAPQAAVDKIRRLVLAQAGIQH